MADGIELEINGEVYDRFISYRVDSRLYLAADAFEVEMANDLDVTIPKDCTCRLLINGVPEFTGIIDKVSVEGDKKKETLKISGRDLMGLLTTHHLEEFISLENMTLEEIAHEVLKDVPLLKRRDLIIGEGSRDYVKPLSEDEQEKYMKINPGDTSFTVLNAQARLRGWIFFARHDGAFVMSKVKTSGRPDYHLYYLGKDNPKAYYLNNVISRSFTDDRAARFSKVTVVGQDSDYGEASAEGVNFSATATDTEFPYFKPLVVSVDEEKEDPSEYAKMLIRKQRAGGLTYTAVVRGHTYNQRPWRINKICHVHDDSKNVGMDKDMVISGVTYTLSKRQGTRAAISLTPLGAEM